MGMFIDGQWHVQDVIQKQRPVRLNAFRPHVEMLYLQIQLLTESGRYQLIILCLPLGASDINLPEN